MTDRVLVLAVLLACGGSSPPATPTTPPTPDRCAFVADHLLTLLSDTARQAPAEELDRVRAAINGRCREDRWSPAAQECFLQLPSKAEIDRCAPLLTESQRASLGPAAE